MIAVVGLLLGTGVSAVLNCLIKYENSSAASATIIPPTGRRRSRGKKGSGQARVSTAPKRREARTTTGGRTTPALATLAAVASGGCWLAELMCATTYVLKCTSSQGGCYVRHIPPHRDRGVGSANRPGELGA